jgi:predicted phosphodiesterase
MKLAVLTDVHANLPALEAVLDDIDAEGADLLLHLGNAIASGPFPAECLDRLRNVRNARLVIGNRDEHFVHGLPQPRPGRAGPDERGRGRAPELDASADRSGAAPGRLGRASRFTYWGLG